MDFTLPCSWSIRACILSWFFLSSSAAKVSSLIALSDLRRFLVTSALRLFSASSSDSSSRILVSILIMAFLPPLRAFTSASSARVAASLHWASSSVYHSTGSLLVGHLGLVGHLVQVGIELTKLSLQLPLCGSDGLVGVGQVSQGLVGVGELLLSSATLAIGSLQESASLLEAVGNGSSTAVGGDLGIGGGGLGGRLVVHLDLGIAHLQSVLLDGGLGLRIAGNGVLEGQAKVSSVSLKLLLHPESLSFALGFCLKGNLHGVQGLRLSLLDEDELLLLLSEAALNLLPDSVKLELAPQHLVLPADFFQLKHGLLVGRLDLEQLRGGVASLLLADIKVEGQAVDLALPLADDLVKLLGLPVHGSVEDLGLVQAVGHVAALRGNLGLGLLNLVQLGVQIVNGSLSFSETSGQLHLGHLELLTLGNGVGLVLLSPALSLTLRLGNKPQRVLAASRLFLEGAAGTVQLMLQVPVLAKEQTSLASLVVAQSLDVVELGGQGSLLLGADVQVVVEVANNAEKVGVLAGNLVLAGGKVSQGQVGIVNLLVDGVEGLQHLLVAHVGGGLSPHHLVGGSAGIGNLIHDQNLVLLNLALHLAECVNLLGHLSSSVALLSLQVGQDRLLLDVCLLNVLPELVHLSLPLLVELHLGGGGTAGLIETLAQLVDLPGKVRPLPLGLGASLTLSLKLLLHCLNASLNLLDSLLGLGNKVLLVIQLCSLKL